MFIEYPPYTKYWARCQKKKEGRFDHQDFKKKV